MNETIIPEEEIREAWKARYGTEKYEGTHFACYSAGQLDYAAKHAEEVALKEAECVELNRERNVMVKHLESQLTAAREREGKAFSDGYSKARKDVKDEEALRVREWREKKKDADNKCPDCGGFGDGIGHYSRECQKCGGSGMAAYDSSRAADGKEGA